MSEEMLSRIGNLIDPPSAPPPAPKAAAPVPQVPANDPVDADAEEIEVLANEVDPDEPSVEQPPVDDSIELEIAGEQKRLTKAELKAIAEEHGTLKPMAETLKAQREAIEQERRAVQEITRIAPMVEQLRAEGRLLAQAMDATYREIQSLTESDPIGAFQKREQLTQMQSRFQQLAMQESQASGYVQQLHNQAAQQQLEAEGPLLLQALPKWKDPAKRQSDMKFIRDYMAEAGYTAEEVGLVTKSRYAVTLLEAAKYRAITKARASKKVTDAPPMARPGTVSSPGLQQAAQKSEYRKAVNTANSKGNPHQAARLVEKELERRLFK